MSKASGCTGKKWFATKDTAKAAARRRKKVYGVPHRAYLCEHCATWHLTTKPTTREDK